MLDAIIDISHHNGTSLDFAAAAAAGVLGVIHKASQGLENVDPLWGANRTAIVAQNLLFGSYHFGDGSDGAAQAQAFLQVVGPNPGELLALDFEQNLAGPSMTIDGARNFVTAIHDSIGKWPVLYGAHYLKDALSGAADPILSNCPLWLAQYGPNAVLPIGWDGWTLWQYTDGAVGSPPPVAGIGHCDQDRFSGDADGLPAFWASVSA